MARPALPASRAGGPIAAAWAVQRFLGSAGYERLTRAAMDATRRLQEGIRAAGFRILGAPTMSVFSFTSDDMDIYALCDALEVVGWKLDRQQLPPAAHLMVSPGHVPYVEPFLADLNRAADQLRGGAPAPAGSAAMYAAMAMAPDRSMVSEMILGFMDSLDQR